jgi:hypothetical protein
VARIRSIKPEFWSDDRVTSVSIGARLTFIGIWNFCDDRGVHPGGGRRVKAEVFPLDDGVSAKQVEDWIEELLSIGLLGSFNHDGQRWLYVPGWHHQVINRPSRSNRPEPPRSTPRKSEHSVSPHGVLSEDSSMEWRGGEGKGEENFSDSKERGVANTACTGDAPVREDTPPPALAPMPPTRPPIPGMDKLAELLNAFHDGVAEAYGRKNDLRVIPSPREYLLLERLNVLCGGNAQACQRAAKNYGAILRRRPKQTGVPKLEWFVEDYRGYALIDPDKVEMPGENRAVEDEVAAGLSRLWNAERSTP